LVKVEREFTFRYIVRFIHAHLLSVGFEFSISSSSLKNMSETTSAPPHKIIGVAIIWNDLEQILIDRRRSGGVMGGLWEFPGGKLEPGETVEECIKREIYEELGIEIKVGQHLLTIDHTYTHLRVTLIVHHCRHLAGVPQPLECEEVRWVSLDKLGQFTFPEANVQIIDALRVVSG
jgi:8-oxo-dGTP diphosphatase